MQSSDISSHHSDRIQGLILLLLITTAVVSVTSLYPAMPLIAEHFHAMGSPQFVGNLLITFPMLCIVLFSPVAGWLADAIGRRNLLAWSCMGFALAGTAPVYLDNFWLIVVSRCVVLTFEAVLLTVSTTLIADCFTGIERRRWLTMQLLTAGSLALVIAEVGAYLSAAFGWRGPFYLFAYGIGLAYLVWRHVKEPSADADAELADETVIYFDMPWLRMTALCLLTIIATQMWYANNVTMAMTLQRITQEASTRLPSIDLLIVSAGMPIGNLIYRFACRGSSPVIVACGFLIAGAAYGLMGNATDIHIYTLAAFMNYAGCGLTMSALLVWTIEGLAFSIRGRGNGLWQSAVMLGSTSMGAPMLLLERDRMTLDQIFEAYSSLALLVALILFVLAASARWFGVRSQRAM
jgi:MFS family permease